MTDIIGGFEITGTYRCKNRVLKTNIRLTTVQFNKTCNFKKGYFLTCDTHGEHKDDNINHTDALFWMRKPWLWCDECAALHFNQEGYVSDNDRCPDCDGSGQVSGDYFSEDGTIFCQRCNGKGLI